MGSYLKRYKLVGLDSNIFSYHFQQHPSFGLASKAIFDLLSADQIKALTSLISLIELLSIKAQATKIRAMEKLFWEVPNLEIIDLSVEIAEEAAAIRRKYGFRTPDAIQLATAKYARAKAFITNDQRLKAYKKLKVISVSELR